MDRNYVKARKSQRSGAVALRKESVDRNLKLLVMLILVHMSLSARRAWIEIANFCRNRFCPTVALRKESVDRNHAVQVVIIVMHASLSARRAWIEIMIRIDKIPNQWSLSARRAWIEMKG